MSTLINIGVEVVLSTTWWVVRKTTYGLYSGIYYLIYGNIETKDEKERHQLLAYMEAQEKLLMEMKQRINELEKEKKVNKTAFSEEQAIKFKSENNKSSCDVDDLGFIEIDEN